MQRKIIIGYNDSDGSRDALALGKLLAENTCADLMLTCVFPDDPYPTFGNAEVSEADTAIALKVEAAADDIGAEAKAFSQRLSGAGTPRRRRGARRGPCRRRLLDTARHRPLSRRQRRAAAPPRPTEPGRRGASRISQPEVRTEDDRNRVRWLRRSEGGARGGSELAAVAGATLRLLASPSVVETGEAVWGHRIYSRNNAMRESFQASLREAVEALPSELRPIGKLLDGGPAAALTSEGESGLDLLCVGSHGYGPLGRAMLGSVSTALVKAAPCPLLIIPRSALAQAEPAAAKRAA